MDPEKPGWATSEFWTTLATLVLSFITALMALLQPGFELPPEWSALVASVAAMAAFIGSAVYTLGRSRVKQQAVAGRQMVSDFKADLALLAVEAGNNEGATSAARAAKSRKR